MKSGITWITHCCGLEDSYHTQGFFKRESSLVRALFNS